MKTIKEVGMFIRLKPNKGKWVLMNNKNTCHFRISIFPRVYNHAGLFEK